MSLFKEPFVDLGETKEGEKLSVSFELFDKDSFDLITKVKSSCGCTTEELSKKNKNVVLVYKAENVPYHLLGLGYFTPTKKVKVFFKDGSSEILAIKVRVNKKS